MKTKGPSEYTKCCMKTGFKNVFLKDYLCVEKIHFKFSDLGAARTVGDLGKQ